MKALWAAAAPDLPRRTKRVVWKLRSWPQVGFLVTMAMGRRRGNSSGGSSSLRKEQRDEEEDGGGAEEGKDGAS